MKSIDMTGGKLGKSIMAFSLPLIFSNILQVLFNMTDIAVVGRFAGADSLGSVGSTSLLVTLFTGLLIGMGVGVNAVTAHNIGAGRTDDVKRTVHTGVFVCLSLGVLISIFGIVFTRPILLLLNTKEELMEKAVLYLRIYFLGMPALGLYNFGNGAYSAFGDTKKPLYFLSFSGVLNVILNLIFVISFNMDVAGVALASIISQYLSAILILVSLFRSKEIIGLRFKLLRFDCSFAKKIIGIGLPTGCQNAIFMLANLFIQRGVNSFSAAYVEGNSAAANGDSLIYPIMASFYTACTSFISQNIGANKKDRVLKSFYLSTLYSFLAGAVLGLLLFIFGRQFMMIFVTEETVIEAGLKRISVMAFSYMFSAFMDNTIAASRGLGKTAMPTFIVIMGSCVFRIIWVYTIFAHFHTIESLYLLYIFSWAITAIAEIAYFVKIWKKEFASS